MRKLIVSCMLLVVCLVAPSALAVDYVQEQASLGPITIQITCPTTDYVGAQTSVVLVTVTIATFSTNDPVSLQWGTYEQDVLVDDAIWEETIDPSTSDPEYDASTDTWMKAVSVLADISAYELVDAQAEVFGYAQITSPNYTAQTVNILVDLITDSTAPETTITSPAAGTYGPDITFQLGATDDYTVAGEFGFYCWLDPLESKPASPGGDTSKTYSLLSAGNYTFYVAAVDLALNEDPTPAAVPITVEIVTAPGVPVFPLVAYEGDLVILTVPAGVSSEGHAVEQRVDFGDGYIDAWSSLSTRDHVYSSAGDYEIRIQSRCASHGIESVWSDPWQAQISIRPILIAPDDGGGCVPAAGHPTMIVLLLSAAVLVRRRRC